jgi:hypothetical protein
MLMLLAVAGDGVVAVCCSEVNEDHQHGRRKGIAWWYRQLNNNNNTQLHK